MEHVSHPEQYIPAMLAKCKTKHLERTYEVSGWSNANEFLELIARKHGRLLKGGEPDEAGVARMVLNDFNRGKIPWFVPPPESKKDGEELEGRSGRLGEMRKRKQKVGDAEGEPVKVKKSKANEEEQDRDDDRKENEEEWKGVEGN